MKDLVQAQKFLKNNPEIVVGRSDKGNSTVVVKKEEYFTEMNAMFDDKTMYKEDNKDPTDKYERQCKKLIKELVDSNSVTKWKAEYLKNHNSLPPKAYGLKKTHKEGKKYRPVICNIDSPTYNLSKFVHGILANVCSTFHRSIKNSFDVCSLLKSIYLPKEYVLISLDVISLFPSIPKQLVEDIISKNWKWFEPYTEIPKPLFLKIIRFLFESSFFVFNEKFYTQLDGTAMGNPCSPSISNLVLEFLISSVLKQFDFDIPITLYYVDDRHQESSP